jgi:hypothetical protein
MSLQCKTLGCQNKAAHRDHGFCRKCLKQNVNLIYEGKEVNMKKEKKSGPKKREILHTSKAIIQEIESAFGEVEVLEPEERQLAPKWDTEKSGDYIFGEITRITDGKFGKMLFLKDCRTKDGVEYLIPNRQALLMEPLIQKAKAGDRLLITCLGKEYNEKSKREFVAYQVQKIKGGAPF